MFIIFVAAGLLAGSLRAFHEAGFWNGLQNTAFDFSALLPQDGLVGTLLAGVFGYQACADDRRSDRLLRLSRSGVDAVFRPAAPGAGARRRSLKSCNDQRKKESDVHTDLQLRFRARRLLSRRLIVDRRPAADRCADRASPILITVTDAGCDPTNVDVAAGKTTFSIKNESQRARRMGDPQGRRGRRRSARTSCRASRSR